VAGGAGVGGVVLVLSGGSLHLTVWGPRWWRTSDAAAGWWCVRPGLVSQAGDEARPLQPVAMGAGVGNSASSRQALHLLLQVCHFVSPPSGKRRRRAAHLDTLRLIPPPLAVSPAHPSCSTDQLMSKVAGVAQNCTILSHTSLQLHFPMGNVMGHRTCHSNTPWSFTCPPLVLVALSPVLSFKFVAIKAAVFCYCPFVPGLGNPAMLDGGQKWAVGGLALRHCRLKGLAGHAL